MRKDAPNASGIAPRRAEAAETQHRLMYGSAFVADRQRVIMSDGVASGRVVPRLVLSGRVASCRGGAWLVVPCLVASCCVLVRRVLSCRVRTGRGLSFRVLPCVVASCIDLA